MLANDAKRRRVLAIMYQFPPSREVGAQSCVQICRYLPAHGWDVTVLTVQERFIAEPDHRPDEQFSGTVLRARVLPDPLSVYRWLTVSLARAVTSGEMSGSPRRTESQPNVGALRKCLRSMLGLPDAHVGWILPAIVRGVSAVREQAVDCLFSSGPWWSNHLVGLALSELTGLPWVAHFRDVWAQGHWVKPVSPQSIRIEKALERRVIKKARAVICVTEMQTKLLQQANPDVRCNKFFTIPNGYDGAEWERLRCGAEETAMRERDKFIITYAGNLYHGRSPYPLFRALASLIDSGAIPRESIEIELLGYCDVAEGLPVNDVAKSYGIADCVRTVGFLSRPESLRRVARSNLLLLLVDEQSYSIPAKIYEYLGADRPILALTGKGAARDLLNETGGAFVVDPVDGAGIESAVLEAFREWRSGTPGQHANRDLVAHFDRRLLVGRFSEVFDSTIAAQID
jgi:hypothetical protein